MEIMKLMDSQIWVLVSGSAANFRTFEARFVILIWMYTDFNSENDWGPSKINITQVGNFTSVPYSFALTPLQDVKAVVIAGAGLNKI